MALFMDVHYMDEVNEGLSALLSAHLKDLAVQEVFGVKHLKFWINYDERTIYILMEAPAMSNCIAAHKSSSKDCSCNLVGVDGNDLNFFNVMRTEISSEDSGEDVPALPSDTLLQLALLDQYQNHGVDDNGIRDLIRIHDGILIYEPSQKIMARFKSASRALLCAFGIRSRLNNLKNIPEFRISLSTIAPECKDIESAGKAALQLCGRMNYINRCGSIYLDDITSRYIQLEGIVSLEDDEELKVLKANDIQFLNRSASIIEAELDNCDFDIDSFCSQMGMSKSQLNRRIRKLSGESPNQLILEIKMRMAFHRLCQSEQQISEVAYDLGFSNPSYFTRVFKRRFKTLPSITKYA
ncbi:helix-turn-helix domain-containing protein [Robertkochia solimangrovi]|uniref:helix-turn-helix domain-containing protein n=1 Tax=Robertkochia solimangrovi TaxID=2213046 RepID=UPI00117CE89B|nr:AraC family transcriptional regulator [Robertkochia solimangrovi]TRZ42848.1 hypothetical protein DMZ48_12320 [Robertkochia solimangrovi]